ncbi:hypothetical protein NEMIN01_1982 [Nematocida minor]|uniref:uncharacterized protein n=1 Tax=Nematocida minor TaxID=1912983 RepID=UPI002220050B|nr:uncharacterized protein NEMIN01_1982 [Nematocida minor]KAI5192368.1 hypothetical protein NEMIN01_1982 [Nematocida minor]
MEKRRADVTPLKKLTYDAKEESNWWDESDTASLAQKKINSIFAQMEEYKKTAEEAECEKTRIAKLKINELLEHSESREKAEEIAERLILQCQLHHQTISQLRKRANQKKEEVRPEEKSTPTVSAEEIEEYIERMDKLESRIHLMLSKYPPNYTQLVKTLEQENKELFLSNKSLMEKIEEFLKTEKELHMEKQKLANEAEMKNKEMEEKQAEKELEIEKLVKEKEIHHKRVDELYLAIETFNSTVVDKTRELENDASNKAECQNNCHEKIKELENKEIDRLEEVAFLVRKYIDTGKKNDELLLEIEEIKHTLRSMKTETEKTDSCDPLKNLQNKNEQDQSYLEIIENQKIEIEKSKLEYLERKSSAQYHKRKSVQYEAELSAAKKTVADLEAANASLQIRLDEIKKNRKSSKSQTDVELYQGMIRCGVCCTNIKDVALKKCMHLMCRSCIDARMASRQKTCPLCGTIFSPNDIANVYL